MRSSVIVQKHWQSQWHPAMMIKLAQSAEKRWLRLRGYDHVIEGRSFQDGILQQESAV